MKFKLSVLTLLVFALLFAGSAFGADKISVALNAKNDLTYTMSSAAAFNGVPMLRMKITNEYSKLREITSITLTNGTNTTCTTGFFEARVFQDVNQNGILDYGDTALSAATSCAITGFGGTVAITLSPTLSIDANATKWVIVNVNVTGVSGTGEALELIWADATPGMTVKDENGVLMTTSTTPALVLGDTTTPDLNAGTVANVPAILLATTPGPLTIAAASTPVAATSVGNKEQNFAVVGFKLTSGSTFAHVVDKVTLADGGFTTAADAGTDLGAAYLYRDKGTIGRYDSADIRVGSITDVDALTNSFDLNGANSKGPIFVAADSSVTMLVVMTLTGTAGVTGVPGDTDAETQEILAIDINAATSQIDGGAALTGSNIEGPAINMVPLYLTAVQTADFDSDGLLNALKLTFSDNVSDSRWASLALNTDIQITDSADAIGSISELAFSSTANGDVANNNYVYVQFSSTSMPASDRYTDGKPRVQLNSTGNATVWNNGGNKTLLAFTSAQQNTASATADKASPVVTGAYTGDVDADGKIDQITVSFSENMGTTAANSYPGVTFASVVSTFGSNGIYTPTEGAVGGSAIVYTIPESGSGIYDSEATPSFRYNNAGTTTNLKDLAGNEVGLYSSSGLTQQSATVDQVAPVIVKAETKDLWTDEHYLGSTGFEQQIPDGRIDTLVLTFSERVTTGSALDAAGEIDAMLAQFIIIHSTVDADVSKWAYDTATTTSPYKPAPVIANSGTYGSSDTNTMITIYTEEQPANATGMTNGGDTGVAFEVTYTAGGSSDLVKDLASTANSLLNVTDSSGVVKDGAAPFIVNGLFQRDGVTPKIIDTMSDLEVQAAKDNDDLTSDQIDVIIAQEGGWDDNKFGTVLTVDSDVATKGSDSETGDGYIDAFHIFFSEPVHITDAVNIASAFTVTNTDKYSTITLNVGVDADADGDVEAADNNIVFTDAVFYGTSSKVSGKYDTGETPTVKFVSGATIYDGSDTEYSSSADNKLAATVAIGSYDTAKPTIVSAIGSVNLTAIAVTWSEDVYSDDAAGENLDTVASNAIFDYDDVDGAGAGDIATDVIDYDADSRVMLIYVDEALTVADVEADSIWIKADEKVYDNADGGGELLAAFTENKAEFDLDGVGYKYIIDDSVAPYIVSATTLDVDGDGLVDYIKLVFSEDMDDSRLGVTLFNEINSMSYNVASNFILSGYTGMAKFNWFENTDLGKAKSITLDKPVFSDNAPDDNILYLELQESKVPPSSPGTTGWAPELTFSNVELADKKPNTLDTSSPVQVADGVGPVLMSARTLTTTTLELTFSEEVNLATVNSGDFSWTLGDALEDFQKLVALITQPTPGIVVLETIVANRWEPNMGGTIAYIAGTKPGIFDLQVTSKGVPTTAGVYSDMDAYTNAVWYKISSNEYVADTSKGMTAEYAEISTEDVVVEVAEDDAPTAYALSENYPNPFNPTTSIEFAIPTAGSVELVIYNINGQKVRTLVNETKDAGLYKVIWDGKNELGETVSSGIYLYRLVSGNFTKMQKMTLLK